MFSRRTFLGTTAGLLGASTLPLKAALAAGPAGNKRKFVFVVNYGGWDPTRVFASEFDNPSVDMERSADIGAVGNLTFVDHPNRPSVRQFFEEHYQRTLMVNGVLVPSVAHENCLHIIMTGSTSSVSADWPAILAGAGAASYALPGVVVGGPSFPGALGSVVTRTGGSSQLEGLLSGDILDYSDIRTASPDARAEAIMDSYLARRAAAAADAAQGKQASLRGVYTSSLERAASLKELLHVVDFSSGTSLSEQIRLAVDLLSLGISRVATVSSEYGWDTHVDNDNLQSSNFEGLFSSLRDLMARLQATPGESAPTLADETVVVVLSEMGRTPQLNATDGKDHWPYTSALLVGPGITGNRVVGGLDEYYYGERIDPETGELDSDGRDLSADTLGSTLLNLADIDHQDYLPGVSSIPGLLS